MRPSTNTLLPWLGYVAFVVYGSLVPLEFRPHSLSDAWAAFQAIPYLKLGVTSRADWIANGVLYLPVGFLTAHLLIHRGGSAAGRTSTGLVWLLSSLFSVVLAFSVEFAQMFFPPRTVSQNDLMAECIGSLLGILLAVRYSAWFQSSVQAVMGDSRRLGVIALQAYTVAYLAYSMFPYDVLLSGAELERKIQSNMWGVLLADIESRLSITGFKLFVEVLLAMPLGLWFRGRVTGRRTTFISAALLGLTFGCLIEFGQLFIASGVSQGLSVIARTVGVVASLALWQHRKSWDVGRFTQQMNRYSVPLGIAYFAVLLEVNGWFSARWEGASIAMEQLSKLRFLPFYYHYYTSEAHALFSLVSVVLTYLPIGGWAWARRRSAALAAVVAASVAMLVEGVKLFHKGAHPDPTNVLLAAAAAWVAFHMLQRFFPRLITQAGSVARQPMAQPAASTIENAVTAAKSKPLAWKDAAMLLPAVAAAAWGVTTFPVLSIPLCLLFLACGLAVWYRPILVFAIVPAALPVLDLAPLSGRFFLDEFDLLLLLCLPIAYLRRPSEKLPRRRSGLDGIFVFLVALFACSYLVGIARGLLPWQFPDANAFNNYFSPYNALRVGKGALWGLLFYVVMKRFQATEVAVRRSLEWGMVAGLAMTVAVVIWERVAFSGLTNFSSNYRVTGPFSAIHTGGAQIEAYLAVAAPFLAALILRSSGWVVRSAGAFLLLATTYCLMVTFSRNGYSAFAVASLVFLVGAVLKEGLWRKRTLLLTAVAALMLAVALPIYKGEFAQTRMSQVEGDLDTRESHWADALSIRSTDWLTTIFGMGVGRYPESNYWRGTALRRTGTYRLEEEAGNGYLRLTSGDSIYVEQLVRIEPGQRYVLRLDVRPSIPNSKIAVPVCEKWMLTSYRCHWLSIKLGDEVGRWQSVASSFTARQPLSDKWFAARPVKLALYYSAKASTIDVDNVRLETVDGNNLLRNGDYSAGLDHWYFSTDGHLQWHIKSLPLSVLFDQGWFGLASLAALVSFALFRGLRGALAGDIHSSAALASLCAFLVVGIFDTVIDAPRFLFLFLLLIWLCATHRAQRVMPS